MTLQETIGVRPLEWSQSTVFGHQKRRGFGVFGEYCSFTVDGLTPEEIAAKEAEYEAGYKARIQSALVPPVPTHQHVKRGAALEVK